MPINPVQAVPLPAEPAITCHSVDALHGMGIEYVCVPDLSDEPCNQALRAATRREIAAANESLRAHPEFPAPVVQQIGGRRVLHPNNPVAAQIYSDKPALRAWRTNLVPSAKSLTPVYHAAHPTLPTGEPIDAGTRGYFLHSLDAIGIRTRAAIMAAVARHYIAANRTTRWASLACSAAIPVFVALHDRPPAGLDITLVDLDPDALAHAAEQAAQHGLREGVDFHLLQRHLIRDLITTAKLVAELGESSMDFVDMLGIFEYIPEESNGLPGGLKSAAVFLRNAFRLVRPGGALVAGNLLDTHTQLDFNQRGLGWPNIYARSRRTILRIITDAGIAAEQVTMRIADDGVFAVVEIRKP